MKKGKKLYSSKKDKKNKENKEDWKMSLYLILIATREKVTNLQETCPNNETGVRNYTNLEK